MFQESFFSSFSNSKFSTFTYRRMHSGMFPVHYRDYQHLSPLKENLETLTYVRRRLENRVTPKWNISKRVEFHFFPQRVLSKQFFLFSYRLLNATSEIVLDTRLKNVTFKINQNKNELNLQIFF